MREAPSQRTELSSCMTSSSVETTDVRSGEHRCAASCAASTRGARRRASKKCCAPRRPCEPRGVAARETDAARRRAPRRAALPIRHATSESPPRYSTLSTAARTPRSNASSMCSGRTPSMPPRTLARQHGRPVGAGDDGAAAAGVERQQVHRRRADEARDERVGRRLVEVDRRAVLLDPAAVAAGSRDRPSTSPRPGRASRTPS